MTDDVSVVSLALAGILGTFVLLEIFLTHKAYRATQKLKDTIRETVKIRDEYVRRLQELKVKEAPPNPYT